MHVKAVIAVLSIIAAVGFLPSRTVASPPKPVIVSAVIDTVTGTLLLRGFNFPTHPKIYMGKDGEAMHLLQVRHTSPNTIEAALRPTSSGTYRITVLKGRGDQPKSEDFVPQSLPAHSPVFADAMMYEIRQE